MDPDDDEDVPVLVPLSAEDIPVQPEQPVLDSESSARRPFERPVPVTLITGFLGVLLRLWMQWPPSAVFNFERMHFQFRTEDVPPIMSVMGTAGVFSQRTLALFSRSVF